MFCHAISTTTSPYAVEKELEPNSLEFSVPGVDPDGSYAIVWSKVVGWKTVTFSWKEQTAKGLVPHPNPDNSDPVSFYEHTFNPETDWDKIARNLHAQDKTSDQWGFLP